MVLNRFPMWKNILVLGVILIAFLYAAPNLYGDDPALQVIGTNASIVVDANTEKTIIDALNAAQIKYQAIEREKQSIVVRFFSTDVQLKAREVVQQILGSDYLVVLV